MGFVFPPLPLRTAGYRLPHIAALSLVLCDDGRIAALNAQHRGKEGPTDVLSFEIEDDELDFKVSQGVEAEEGTT